MGFDIVLITAGRRRQLLHQTIDTLRINAVDKTHHLTVVLDGAWAMVDKVPFDRLVASPFSVGASRSRNVGAASYPKYLRQSHVMFIDDDVYMIPKWDETLAEAIEVLRDSGHPSSALSGHAHPFNHHYAEASSMVLTNVLSTVHMLIPWSMWDDVGPFAEPGGPGGSEDVDWCARATAKGYRFAVTKPHCVIHTGLVSSSGKPIVGYKEMEAMNQRLILENGIAGKVVLA